MITASKSREIFQVIDHIIFVGENQVEVFVLHVETDTGP